MHDAPTWRSVTQTLFTQPAPARQSALSLHALPALTLILGNALGMTVETIVATRTLSERFGAPTDEVAAQHRELAAAHETAVQAARRLG